MRAWGCDLSRISSSLNTIKELANKYLGGLSETCAGGWCCGY